MPQYEPQLLCPRYFINVLHPIKIKKIVLGGNIPSQMIFIPALFL